MRTFLSLTCVLALGALMLSCTTDTTLTAPDEDVLAKSSQDDPSEWKLLTQDTILPGTYFLDLECINDGAGETGDFFGTWSWYGKEVTTPSGNYMQNAKAVFEEGFGFVGLESGDVWMATNVVSPVFTHTKKKNGHSYSTQPDTEWYVNQDGERARFHWLWHIEFDENWDILKWDERMINCRLYK